MGSFFDSRSQGQNEGPPLLTQKCQKKNRFREFLKKGEYNYKQSKIYIYASSRLVENSSGCKKKVTSTPKFVLGASKTA